MLNLKLFNNTSGLDRVSKFLAKKDSLSNKYIITFKCTKDEKIPRTIGIIKFLFLVKKYFNKKHGIKNIE